MVFREYCLTADSLYLGERPKGEIFKPCIRTIPFSQITGALNSRFARTDFKAVGCLIDQIKANRDCFLIYSPRERVADHSKVPLQVHFLTNVVGTVFIVGNEASQKLDKEFDILMGGMRSRGFGRCKLTYFRDIDDRKIVQGELKTRLPVSELNTFGIIETIMPRYGYLWRPEPKTLTGCYVISLFEGSIIKGPHFLTH